MKNKVDIETENFLVGEFESNEANSGITSFFIKKNNITGISQNGGSPATMNTESLHPLHRENTSIDALVITGRSVFGFIPALEIIKLLHSRGNGLKIRHMNVPIVPAAAIFDFINNKILPDPSWGKKTFENMNNKISTGSHAAGKGATVGKVLGIKYSMKSGQNYEFFKENGLEIAAYIVVNAFGDIYNEKNEIIAGARRNGKFINTLSYLEKYSFNAKENQNTTISVILTNAKLNKEETCRISGLVNIALGNRIKPFNTTFDGDTTFTISFGEIKEPFEKIATLAQKIALNTIDKIFI